MLAWWNDLDGGGTLALLSTSNASLSVWLANTFELFRLVSTEV